VPQELTPAALFIWFGICKTFLYIGQRNDTAAWNLFRAAAYFGQKSRRKRCNACGVAQREGFEPSCDCSQTDFESLKAGVFWSILSASLRLSERRKPLILLGFPAFLLSAQDFGNFPVKADFPEKCEHSVSVL